MNFWKIGTLVLGVVFIVLISMVGIEKVEISSGMDSSLGSIIVILFVSVISFAIYFVPSVVAHKRSHPNETAIAILNLLLGWTLIGWVASLVWSLTNPQRK